MPGKIRDDEFRFVARGYMAPDSCRCHDIHDTSVQKGFEELLQDSVRSKDKRHSVELLCGYIAVTSDVHSIQSLFSRSSLHHCLLCPCVRAYARVCVCHIWQRPARREWISRFSRYLLIARWLNKEGFIFRTSFASKCRVKSDTW